MCENWHGCIQAANIGACHPLIPSIFGIWPSLRSERKKQQEGQIWIGLGDLYEHLDNRLIPEQLFTVKNVCCCPRTWLAFRTITYTKKYISLNLIHAILCPTSSASRWSGVCFIREYSHLLWWRGPVGSYQNGPGPYDHSWIRWSKWGSLFSDTNFYFRIRVVRWEETYIHMMHGCSGTCGCTVCTCPSALSK